MANKKKLILPPGFIKPPLGLDTSEFTKRLDEKLPIRVIIGMGCTDTVKSKTLETLMGICLKTTKGAVTGFCMRQGGDIVSARTYCVKYARENMATHIFFVDSDMKFPPDTLDKLLEADKDIVTVEYSRRKLPPDSVTQPLEERSGTELYKARVIGAGCLLIKLSVFDAIDAMNAKREPEDRDVYFNFGRNSQGELVIGEDTWFSNVARDAGIDSWINPQIKVAHLGEYEFSL